MNVFITGIAGFVGSHLAKHLQDRGARVFGIDNLSTGSAKNLKSRASFREADIRNADAFRWDGVRVDGVVHLAAQTSGEKSFELPAYDMDTNLKGSLNAFQFAVDQKASWFINMSSMSVYGDHPQDQLASEKTAARPISLYGNTKLAAERMLTILSQRYDLPVTTLRLFNAYGPGQNLDELKQGMVSIYLAYLLRENHIHVKGSGSRVRDFVFISDILAGLEAVIEKRPQTSGIYNLSTGFTTPVDRVLALLQKSAGTSKLVKYEGTTPGDIDGFGGDSSRFATTFGWTPKVSIADGIDQMVQSYL